MQAIHWTLVVEDSVHPMTYTMLAVRSSRHELTCPTVAKRRVGGIAGHARGDEGNASTIEPNPSARGTTSKFHYPSHRLRFDVQRPLDGSTDDFVARVNAAAQSEEEGDPVNPRDPDWFLGDRKRHRGSLHQDVWCGHSSRAGQPGLYRCVPFSGLWHTGSPRALRFASALRPRRINSYSTSRSRFLYNAIAQKFLSQSRSLSRSSDYSEAVVETETLFAVVGMPTQHATEFCYRRS